jgi:hypothetical protein
MLPNHFTVPIFATAAGSKLSHPVKTQVDSLKDAAAQAKSLATATVTIASTSSPAPAAAVAAPIATPRNDSTFASKTSNHKNPKTVKHADTSVVVAQKAANGNAHTTTATMTSYAATTSAASTTDTIDATTTITTTTTSTTSTTTNEPGKFQLNVNAPEWGGAPAVALRTKPAQPVPVAHKAKPTPPVPAPLTAVERVHTTYHTPHTHTQTTHMRSRRFLLFDLRTNTHTHTHTHTYGRLEWRATPAMAPL